ncbi:MAG: S49 family peptidase, partial [Fimbriiglobus sp.]
MNRWMLTAALAAALLTSAQADAPKKTNPFIGDKPAETDAKKPDGKAKKAPEKRPDAAEPAEPGVRYARVAHIKLTGDLGEAPTPAENLFGPPQENLRIKLDRIRKAAKDERIQALILDFGSGESEIAVGYGRLNELRTAVADFRKTGKKAYCFAESLDTKQLLLGLACDKLIVPESAIVGLYGLRAEVTYYKNTLDLLKLKADVLKMGAYKSAVEPFLTDKMSKENREQVTALLDDNYENELVANIIAARPAKKWTAADVKAAIDQGPFTAKKAAEIGLVDKIAYE